MTVGADGQTDRRTAQSYCSSINLLAAAGAQYNAVVVGCREIITGRARRVRACVRAC